MVVVAALEAMVGNGRQPRKLTNGSERLKVELEGDSRNSNRNRFWRLSRRYEYCSSLQYRLGLHCFTMGVT